MDSFQEVIKEDIRELISEKSCLFCGNRILFRNLGGFKHALDNILDLENPVCIPCWEAKEEELSPDVFAPLEDVLDKSEGSLTGEVELITVDKDNKDNLVSEDFKPSQDRTNDCPHEYTRIENNKLQCRLCYKRFSVMAE